MSQVATEPEPDLGGEESEELGKDEVFELLKNPRRRAALRYLDEAEGTVTLSDLAEHIAAQENDVTVEQLNAYQRKRVYIALYQCHLPTMDESDVIDYDQDRGNIDIRDEAEKLFEYLAMGDDGEQGLFADDLGAVWSRRYLALSAVGGVLAAAVQFTAVGFAIRTGLTLAVLALFLAVSLVHTYETRRRRTAADGSDDDVDADLGLRGRLFGREQSNT
jgi:DNA-binding transcriptional ArsR family regulator